MVATLLSRIGHALLSMLGLLVLVFCLVRLTGDPVNYLLPTEHTLEQEQHTREHLGLDRPFPVQFAIYAASLVRGDLGDSFRSRRPVLEMIAERAPATLT